MNIKEYFKESAKTESPLFNPDAVKPRTMHGIMGLASEGGELLDAAKKAMYYGKTLDLVNVKEEVGEIGEVEASEEG